MFAKIRHVATNTERYDTMAKFYQTVFGMKQITTGLVDETGQHNPNRGHISDGVIGMALSAERPGSHQGLDHFGFECEDIKEVLGRIKQKYPELLFTKALSYVPFAGIGTGSHRDAIRPFTERHVQRQRGISERRLGTTTMAKPHRASCPRT